MSLKNNINFKEGVFRRLMADAKITMDDLLAQAGDNVKQLTVGETVDGTVLSVKKHEILIDLGPLGVGLVPRREVSLSKNYIPNWKTVIRYFHCVRLRKIVVGMKLWLNWNLVKSSPLCHTMLTVVDYWLNTKVFADSCQYRNCQLNTILA